MNERVMSKVSGGGLAILRGQKECSAMKTIIAALLTLVLLAPSFAEASQYRHHHGYHHHYRHYSHYRTYHYRYWPAFASRSSLARAWPTMKPLPHTFAVKGWFSACISPGPAIFADDA
jgi:hypothetical protein